MEIKIKLEESYKKLNLGKINMILGKNNSGKTKILNTINEGVLGKSEYFEINGISKPKGMYDSIYLSTNREPINELKLNNKSTMYNNIIKPFISENAEKLEQIANEFIKEVNKLFYKEKEYKYKYLLSSSELKLTETKINKLENLIFELNFESEPNHSILEEFYINQKIKESTLYGNTILLIDNIDMHLDFKVIQNIINQIKKLDNITLIMTSKNKYILNEIETNKIYDTNCREIKVIEKAKYLMFEEYLSKENSKYTIDDYILNNQDLYLEEDYQKFLRKNKLKVINELKI